MIRQKQIAVMGVNMRAAPVSHGTIIPTQPNNSQTPNILIGIIVSFGFMCPSSMCFCILPLTFPKPGIMKKAERSPCIIHKAVFIY